LSFVLLSSVSPFLFQGVLDQLLTITLYNNIRLHQHSALFTPHFVHLQFDFCKLDFRPLDCLL
ncbi:hypothetical protein ACLK31_05140, partial [Leptospira borgpetersenii]